MGRSFLPWREIGSRRVSGARFGCVEVGSEKSDSEKTVREQLKAVIAAEIERGTSALWVVLIGHGTFDGRETKFNVRGPDFTDGDLAEVVETVQGNPGGSEHRIFERTFY